MPWLQLSLTVDQAQAPLVETFLEGLGALSVTFGDAADQPLLEPAPGEIPLWRQVRLTALFDGETEVPPLRAAIEDSLPPDITRTLEQERLEDRVWERTWMEDFRPMRFGRRLWVCPAGQRPDQADAVTLDLDPGLAFGTGTHPTTALCLRWLDGAEIGNAQVVDFGCGSGILAVAAAMLGAASVAAVDHDPQALEATRDNAAKNRVIQRIAVYTPDQLPQSRVDLVLANILAGTLVELAPRLCGLLRPGGRLVLSGILQEQTDEVAAAYREWIALEPSEIMEEWVLLHGIRREG